MGSETNTNARDGFTVGLIGSGIGESLSPALHEREASLLGLDYSYVLLDLDELGRPADDVGELIAEAQARRPVRAERHPSLQAARGRATSTSSRPRPTRSAR